METVHSVSEPIPAAEHSVKKNAQVDPKQQEELTEEERLAEMERMLAFAHLMPTIDPWGQDITETLGGPSFYLQGTNYSWFSCKSDVTIPFPVSLASPSKETYDRAKANLSNFVKNSSTYVC